MAGTNPVQPTRFPGGLSTDVFRSVFGRCGAPNPAQWITYWNDMTGSPGPSIPNATDQQYTVTKTGAGTIAPVAGAGGLSLLTTSAGAADNIFVQSLAAGFNFTANKRFLFEAQFSCSEATLCDFFIGMQNVDVTPLDVTDGLFFIKVNAQTAIQFRAEKADVATTLSLGAYTPASMITVGFAYLGRPIIVAGVTNFEIIVYLNKAPIGSFLTTNVPLTATNLCVSFGLQNSGGVSRTMTVDYIFAAVER